MRKNFKKNLLENLRKITFEKKIKEHVALTTFSGLLEKLENQDLPAASPTLLCHPYHRDKGEPEKPMRKRWPKKFPLPISMTSTLM